MPDLIFKIQGTFQEKPILMVNDDVIPYETLHINYLPAEQFGEVSYPEEISLSFSLSGEVGQLKTKVLYTVKGNKNGELVLASSEPVSRNKNNIAPKLGGTVLGNTAEASPGSSLYKELWRKDLKARFYEEK